MITDKQKAYRKEYRDQDCRLVQRADSCTDDLYHWASLDVDIHSAY